MNNKKVINYSILKINRNEFLSINTKKLRITLKILRDDQKQYFVKKNKFQILQNKIENTIKKHHDDLLQKHSRIAKILQLLRQNYQFFNMRQHIEKYIKKCFNCQKNKYAIHVQYEHIQYQNSSKTF